MFVFMKYKDEITAGNNLLQMIKNYISARMRDKVTCETPR